MGRRKIRFTITFPGSLVYLYGDAVFKRGRKIIHHGFDKKWKKPTLRRGFDGILVKPYGFTSHKWPVSPNVPSNPRLEWQNGKTLVKP